MRVCVCVQESLKIPILLLCADKLCYEKLPGQTAGSLAWLPDWVVEGKETGKGRRKEGQKSETTPKFPKFSGGETSEHPVKSVHRVSKDKHNPATPALSAISIYSLIIWLLWSSIRKWKHYFYFSIHAHCLSYNSHNFLHQSSLKLWKRHFQWLYASSPI